MSKEITVILKDDERTFREKFLIYEEFSVVPEDPIINHCIESARKNFNGEPDDIQIRVLMVIK